jgi:hypothetical protein
MFEPDIFPITLNLLEAPSARHTFSQEEITWLRDAKLDRKIYSYLHSKSKCYGNTSWIGTNGALKKTLEAYRQGKIHIIQGNIVGNIIPDLSRIIREQDQEVTLIYLSTASVVDSKTSLETLKKLPLAQSARIIYVGNSKFDCNHVPKPYGCYGIMDWYMIIFQPFSRQDWLTKKDEPMLEKIAPGCYRLKQ